jgi:hypothetical protein
VIKQCGFLLVVAVLLRIADAAVVVNEIYPRATSQCSEWIELHNTSDSPVSLKGWHIGHVDDSVLISASDIFISAKGFLVITKDSLLFLSRYPASRPVLQPLRWHTLDNYHDTILLFDNTGSIVDSAAYDSKWFADFSDQSIARVSLTASPCLPGTWVAAQKATPDQPNPESVWRNTSDVSMDIAPIPFTPNNDGKDDYLSIRLQIPSTVTVDVSIYGMDGKKYWEANAVSSPQTLWNGQTSTGSYAPNGPFFVVCEVRGNVKKIIRKKGILWR